MSNAATRGDWEWFRSSLPWFQAVTLRFWGKFAVLGFTWQS